VINTEPPRPDGPTAADLDVAAASSLDAPAGVAQPAGNLPGAAASEGKDEAAAPDLPPRVADLIRYEAHLYDAVGAPVARPPADIRCRLWFFCKTAVTLDQVVDVLQGRWQVRHIMGGTAAGSGNVTGGAW